MTLLEHPDAQALLEDAVLDPEQLHGLATQIDPLRCRRRRRIYPWHQRTGQFPPRRARMATHTVQGTASETSRPPRS